MLLATIIFVVILSVLIYTVTNKKQANVELPPGPWSLPLLGNLLQFAGTKPHLKLSQWAQQYGKLYTFRLGRKRVLVINDLKMIRELLGLKAATSTPIAEIAPVIPYVRWGLLAKGKAGMEQRQFLTRVIKKFGFGETSCKETLIKQEVRQLVTWIKSEQENGRKVYLKEKLKEVSANMIWAICTEQRIQANPELSIVATGVNFINELHKIIKDGLVFCPWIRYFAPRASGFKKYITSLKYLHKHVARFIKHRILTREKGEEPQNIIDSYIDKVESCEDNGSSFYGKSAGWKHSVCAIVSFFVASGDGSGLITNWIIFYLCVYPEVQRKVHQEIDEVIGSGREASLADKQKMPYTEAVILEALRFSSLVPTGVTRQLTENITFHGYRLPEGMFIQPLLYHVHFDKTIWGDPENFRPERFLGDDIKLKEFVVLFQGGKRMSPAEEIVHDILFFNVTMLLQKYTFKTDQSEIRNFRKYLDPQVTLLLEPKSLPVLAIERK